MSLFDALPQWLSVIVRISLDGSILALALMVLNPLLPRSVPARWRVALWIVVLCRFSPLPFPESRLSLFNLMPHGSVSAATTQAPAGVSLRPEPAPDFAAPGNPILPNRDVIEGSEPIASHSHFPSPPFSPSSTSIYWQQLAAGLYAFGAGFVLLRLTLASFTLHRTVRRARPAADPHLLALLNLARHDMKIRAPLPLLLTDESTGPALVGLFRPRLLLPAHLSSRLSTEELRLVFLHECAHLRRRDVLLNYFLAAVSVLHWFNPVTWLMLARVRSERELACDERVLDATTEPNAYGHVLLKLADLAGAVRSPVAVGIIESSVFFARRIRMIAGFRKQPRWVSVASAAAVAIVAVCALTAPDLRGQEKSPVAPSPGPAPKAVENVDRPKTAEGNAALSDGVASSAAENDRRVLLLERKVQVLEALSGTNMTVSLAYGQFSVEVAALHDLLQDVEKTRTELSIAEAELQAAEKQAADGKISPEGILAAQSDTQLRDLEQMRVNLQIERAGVLASVKPNPSARIEIEAKLESIDVLRRERTATLAALASHRDIDLAQQKVSKARTVLGIIEKVAVDKQIRVRELRAQVQKELDAQKPRAATQLSPP